MSHTQPKHEIKEIKENAYHITLLCIKPNIRKMVLDDGACVNKKNRNDIYNNFISYIFC